MSKCKCNMELVRGDGEYWHCNSCNVDICNIHGCPNEVTARISTMSGHKLGYCNDHVTKPGTMTKKWLQQNT